MWHDFFYYRRGERIGVIILLAIIIGLLFVLKIYRRQSEPITAYYADSLMWRVADSFYQSLEPLNNRRYIGLSPRVRRLDYFDPNTADSLTFLDLGLPRFVAHNILQYRRKGGQFRTPYHFSRIYGLDSSDYQLLLPYIQIDTTRFRPTYKKYRSDSINIYPEKYDHLVRIELNSADTAKLMKVPGIGRGFAHMLVGFRMRLGGFYSIDQLRELRGVDDSLFCQWKPWFYVDSTQIKPIDVNTASITKMRNHPYLNFYQAKVIYELRRKSKKIQSLEDLSLLEEFSENDFQRLQHYLCFE